MEDNLVAERSVGPTRASSQCVAQEQSDIAAKGFYLYAVGGVCVCVYMDVWMYGCMDVHVHLTYSNLMG